MDVLDRDEQRLAVRRSLHQLGDDALLALRSDRRIHRFMKTPLAASGCGTFEQIAQIDAVVCRAEPQLTHGRLDRTFDNVGRRVGSDADDPASTVRTAPWPRSVPKSRTKPE